MGFERILKGFLFASVLDLWRISLYFTIVFGVLFYYYQKLIFLILAIISFVSIFIFNSFVNKTAHKLQESNKIEYVKNPKKYTSEFRLGIIIGIFFFIGVLILEIINILRHSPSERIYDYISIAILFLVAITIFPLWIRRHNKMKSGQIE